MSRARPIPPVFVAVVLRPILGFFRLQAASAILLFVCALLALAWANSPWAPLYHDAFGLPLSLGAAGFSARFSLGELVNDGLMAVFFLLVGMEIKRELVVGELSTVRKALLPAIGAAGGMAAPALFYLFFTRGTGDAAGWGIPTATDIAFSVGVLTLFRGRLPLGLLVFLTALAIFDDLGGILVIALFYGHGLKVGWLSGALGVALLLYLLNRAYVRSGLAYAFAGVLLWLCLHEGGIHATIAGVILGMSIPARAARPSREVLRELHVHTGTLISKGEDEDLGAEELLQIEERIEGLEPPLNRFVHVLHPYVAFVIVPLFGLANSGVGLAGVGLSDLLHPVCLGVFLGLFLGKQLGIFAATALAVKLGVAPLPGGGTYKQLYAVAVTAGIGFTVALFIAGLAFPGGRSLELAKLGILLGSGLSGLAGALALHLVTPRRAGIAPTATP